MFWHIVITQPPLGVEKCNFSDAAQPRSDAIFVLVSCYMLVICTPLNTLTHFVFCSGKS